MCEEESHSRESDDIGQGVITDDRIATTRTTARRAIPPKTQGGEGRCCEPKSPAAGRLRCDPAAKLSCPPS
jgi:hypothetical protein